MILTRYDSYTAQYALTLAARKKRFSAMLIRRHLCPQHGTILLESLVALAVLSLGAAAMFRAFDVLEATSHAASEYGAQALATLNQTEDR